MKFTDAAKQTFQNLLKENQLDVVFIELVWNEDESCQIHLEALKNEDVKELRVTNIDGLNVAITEADENALDGVIFNAENGEIIIEVPHHHHEDGKCCHHHHHGEGECCHHHHHEEGECCHHHDEDDCCCHHE